MRAYCQLIILSLLFSATSVFLSAQQLYVPLTNETHQFYEKQLLGNNILFHTSIKPYIESDLLMWVNHDSVIKANDSLFISQRKNKRVWRKILNEPLDHIDTNGISQSVSFLLNWEGGRVLNENKNTYVNAKGLWLYGNLGKKFSYSTSVYEIQSVFPAYIYDYSSQTEMVPGQARIRRFKTTGFDYAVASGYLSYTPNKYFNFQFGHDKNFIGDGYRSLLLSDVSANYPFLKVTTNLWKLKYVNIFTEFQDIRYRSSGAFVKKYGTFHYLSWIASKKFQVGIFESVIWRTSDSTQYRGYELNYLNPVILYRPIDYGLGSPDNILMGLNAKLRLTKKSYLYGQFAVDDFNFEYLKKGNGFYQEKYGFQAGLKVYDLLNIHGLDFRSEYNHVRPFTYSHKETIQNYAHSNQPLAHPLGANFKESVNFISYAYKRVTAEIKFLYALYGADSGSSHYGKNIYGSDYNIPDFPESFGHVIGQGIKTNLIYTDFCLRYLINPKINLNFEIKFSHRELNSSINANTTNWITLGLKTSLYNMYYDF